MRAGEPSAPHVMKSMSEADLRPRRLGLRAYLACIRYPEVIVLQGSPLLGVAFALGRLTPEKALAAIVFAAASFLLVAHIWTFNDWAGLTADLNDPNKSDHVYSTKGVSSRGLLLFSLGLLGASLTLFAFTPPRTVLIAVSIAMLGLIYSHPALSAKSAPVLSSLPHLLGGLLHFLLGYSLFDALDRRGILIGFFFALTFTAGHLNQEVRDHEGDRVNGLRTNAVFFGKERTFLAGLVLFMLAYADLAWLAFRGLIPAALGVLPLVLGPIHLALSVRALRRGLSFDSVGRLQRGYRTLYMLIGLGMVVALVLG
jgi:4-hydroxybenzoate polyprenyltransferase